MPTLLRIGKIRIVIYTNDHRPAHIHAIAVEGEAVFILNCPNGPVELRETYGFSLRQASDLMEQITEELHFLCEKWNEYHDDP